MKRNGGDTDAELFDEAMSGVRRLRQDRTVPEIVFRKPVPPSAMDREALRELDRLIAGKTPLPLQDTAEYIEGAVPGLDRRTLVKLQRGEFTVQADIDLHGVDAETARKLVERFILECHTRGLRCARIVHGRGRNSPDGVPVLKSRLPRWLSRGPARSAVLAYTSAHAKDRGAGATYVLLRRRGRPRRPDPL